MNININMVRHDVDGGAQFRKPTTVAALTAAGVELDAETDADAGEDVCRIVCFAVAADEGPSVHLHFEAQFLQTTLLEALNGKPPWWTRGSVLVRGMNRAIRDMFAEAEHAEIDRYVVEWTAELEHEHKQYQAGHEWAEVES